MNGPNLAFPAALAGSLDTAWFLARRPGLFRSAPGRACGSFAFLAVWATLAARTAYEGDGPATPYTLVLAGTAFAGSAALLAVHLRHGIASPRVFFGALAGGAVLADCMRRR